jgi:hypothetical protein
MDRHVLIWASVASIVIAILGLIYLYMNYTGGSAKTKTKTGGGWTVYGSNKCGWTRKQTAEMEAKGVQYKFVDCDKEDCPGVDGFPTLKNDDGTVKVGFTPM